MSPLSNDSDVLRNITYQRDPERIRRKHFTSFWRQKNVEKEEKSWIAIKSAYFVFFVDLKGELDLVEVLSKKSAQVI